MTVGVYQGVGGGLSTCMTLDENLPVAAASASAVRLVPPTDPLYVSGWGRFAVHLDDTVDLDDLVFAVDPPEGGLVSHSRDETFDEDHPDVVVAACGLPGTYELHAYDRWSRDLLATTTFRVDDAWAGPDGPPVAYVGRVGDPAGTPAWGGGDPYLPQNLDVHPTVGQRRVAVVLVETTDLDPLADADAAVLRDTWRAEVFDGVLHGGVTESAAIYWHEVSDHQLTLVDAGVVGPLRLGSAWDAITTADSTGKSEGVFPFARAGIAAVRAENAARAADGLPPLVDLTTVDTVVVVPRSIPADPVTGFPGRFQWPYATVRGTDDQAFEVDRLVVDAGFTQISLPVMRVIQCSSMPHDWDARGSRTIAETASHELGHTFGLPDEYAMDGDAPTYQARDLDGWTLMSSERNAPEPTVPEKMRLGWVRAGKVRTLSAAVSGPVDEEVVLHNAEHGPAPAGRYAAVELRIRDGENYYFEYRRDRPTEVSDQSLPADLTVLGTHVLSGDVPSEERRPILRIRDDGDGDRGEFQRGDDYRETDTTDPSYPNDFALRVLETRPEYARVKLTYGDAKPDPQIRPYAMSTHWQSPDVEVANARSQTPGLRNVPWAGHPNTVLATVRNPGKVDAPGVRVEFSWLDMTVAGGPEMPLGSQTLDVPTDAEVVFTAPTTWVPPTSSSPHFCVVARIAEYTVAGAREIIVDNNVGRSNYSRVVSASASPSTRTGGVVKVTNPYPVAADCVVSVLQTSPIQRTYLEHSWVRLEPHGERDVAFRTESMIGDPNLPDALLSQFVGSLYEPRDELRLTGIARLGTGCHGHVTGGAGVLVTSGRATRFVRFEVVDGVATGQVEEVGGGHPASGSVLVTLRRDPDGPAREVAVELPVRNGTFRGQVTEEIRPQDIRWAQAHFVGGNGQAPCDSDELLP
ncbi:M6 family metalloprotease domain-containing protein [Klenkia soli]|uniref:M6 family metalloprotease domain-containing protein n=1 Tax=Klenkia soli TaxID=1052260 RepID=A0A1H0N2U7_9ACTN|nr:hypothetical protein [Klenkia soli]SDO86836.1 M6 family metalloprotease domain-containing protein [Klenkia soli]